MTKARAMAQWVSGIFLASLATLIVFGLVLSLLWALGPESGSSKLISALISVALALGVGGFVIAWFAKRSDLALPGLFGFLFGGLSFAYILGLNWLVLVFAVASTLVAVSGALLFRLVAKDGPTPVDLNPGRSARSR